MDKPVSIRSYLKSINNIVLPEPWSPITREFVKYVLGAHSWYKGPNGGTGKVGFMVFNFYVGPGPLIESKGGINEIRYEKFQNLKYGAPSTVFDVKHRIPREVYDAGQSIVPFAAYTSDESQAIMVGTIARMLFAITQYRERHPSLRKGQESIESKINTDFHARYSI